MGGGIYLSFFSLLYGSLFIVGRNHPLPSLLKIIYFYNPISSLVAISSKSFQKKIGKIIGLPPTR